MLENIAERNHYQAQLFGSRLKRKYRLLRKWARRERITCYRLYDRDIPEIPLAADLYEFLPQDITSKMEAARLLREETALIASNDQVITSTIAERQYLHLYLYERPYEKDEIEEEQWLNTMAETAASLLGISPSHVITKLRKKQKGDNQYEKKTSTQTIAGLVQEQGQLFRINLSDYLDTGLFFDHRPLRSVIRESCSGKSVLNLFCYTGSFSVYAAEGRALRVESVDLSNTYLDWAQTNFSINEFIDHNRYIFTRADVTGFLNQKLAEVPSKDKDGIIDGSNRYDIIILDPPTFSNSKSTSNTLDINRDWPTLITKCLNLLKSGGCLYFSTNSRRLSFDRKNIPQATIEGAVISVTDITEDSLPEDYKGTKIHRAWKFQIGTINQ